MVSSGAAPHSEPTVSHALASGGSPVPVTASSGYQEDRPVTTLKDKEYVYLWDLV